MTTSWAFATHGRLNDALRTHVAGTVLAVIAMITSTGALAVAASGKRLAWRPGELVIVGLAACLVSLVLVEWAFRLLVE